MDDAKVISRYAKNKEMNASDIKIAVMMAQNGIPISHPTHEVRF